MRLLRLARLEVVEARRRVAPTVVAVSVAVPKTWLRLHGDWVGDDAIVICAGLRVESWVARI